MRGATELLAYEEMVWVIRAFLRVDNKVRYICELEGSRRTYVTAAVQWIILRCCTSVRLN